MSGFEQKVKFWLELMENQRSSEAEEYYWDELFDDVVELVRHKGAHFNRGVKYLVSPVGMSPEPIILTIKTLEPEEVLFLYTDDSKKILDIIIERTNLKPSQFSHREIDSSRTEDIYLQIREYLRNKSSQDVAIDISGGKKSMVGGAAQAAAILGCRTIYVDTTDYRREWRKPFPGTEFLVFLENPYQIFGELEMRESLRLYREGNYHGALQILNRLKERVPDIQKVNIMHSLIRFHSLWEEYQFEAALEVARQTESQIVQFRQFNELIPQIDRKIELFNNLVDDSKPEYLVLNHYFFSQKYFERGRFDFAVLLLYRTMELAFSIHLKSKYNLDSSHAIYEDEEMWLPEFNKIAREVFGDLFNEYKELPKKLGFMTSVFLLKVYHDRLMKGIKLKSLRYQADKRNSGILAHGIRPNTESDYRGMESVFRPIIERFCEFYFDGKKLADFTGLFSPVRIEIDIAENN
ncbi:MAG: hypothetical protein Kow0037_18340 [Calditrichia bacterium]